MPLFPAFTLVLALQAAPAQTPAAATVADAYLLYIEGRSAAETGDTQAAVAKYRAAIAAMPQAAEIRAELANLYAQQNDLTNAATEAERALQIDPDNQTANRLMGLITASRVSRAASADARSVIQTAIQQLERSQAAALRDPLVMLTLGELYLRAGDHAKSIYILQQFLIDRPGYPQATMLLVQAYRESGQPDAANEVIKGFDEAVSETPAGLMRSAEALEERGDWAGAVGAWSRVLEADPRDLNARMRYAAALVNGGDLPRGREELLSLTRDEPREVAPWHLLAQVELRAGRFDEAEQAARRIETIDPADARGPLALADVRAARNDHAGIVVVLEPKVTSPSATDVANGMFTEMALRLGDAWQELGNEKRALATLEGARKHAPDDMQLAFGLAAAYEQAGDLGKAEKAFREVIDADPEHAAALNYLGYMLADRGRKLPEAVGLIQRALKIDGDNPAYLDSLGWAYFRQGRYADAVSPLERAAAGAPTSSVIQDHLGDAYARVGRHADAAAAFERALSGDLDGVTAAALTRKRDRARQSSGKR